MNLKFIFNFAVVVAIAALLLPVFNNDLNAAVPDSQPAKWIRLFADEDWYKNQAGKEQTYSGKLEVVKQVDGATTLMRTSYYRMGGRNIYTGGKKIEALDRLAGKNVEIKGKLYDISLEGQAVSEIWPAEIRQREAGASTVPVPPPTGGKD